MGYADIEGIQVDVDGGVAFATIDHPPLNLLGASLLGALAILTERVAEDDAVRVLVLRSADPDFFVAHGDVESIIAIPVIDSPPVSTEPGFVHQVLDRFRVMPVATIAQIEGYARGGGSELALACDMRFAAAGRAVFGQPEVGLGILPGAGGTARLLRLVGRARAAEIILGGDDFSAEEAERYGWVNGVLPPGEIGAFVEGLARRIARFPARAIAEIKAALAAMESETLSDFVIEGNAFARLMCASDPRPRMRRALERGWQEREGERDLGRRLADLAD